MSFSLEDFRRQAGLEQFDPFDTGTLVWALAGGDRSGSFKSGMSQDQLQAYDDQYNLLTTAKDARGRLRYGTDLSGIRATGATVGEVGAFDPVTIDGKRYVRTGTGWDEWSSGGDPTLTKFVNQYGVRPEHFIYTPEYGNLMLEDAYTPVVTAYAATQKNGLTDKLTQMPKVLGGLAMGAALGGAFPGIDAAGASIPAGQTSIWSQLGIKNPFSNIFGNGANPNVAGDLPGAVDSTSWGVGPRGTDMDWGSIGDELWGSGGSPSNMTIQDLVRALDPQSAMSQTIPGISTAGTSGSIPGAAASGGGSLISQIGKFFGIGGDTPAGASGINALRTAGLISSLVSGLVGAGGSASAADSAAGAADRATAAQLGMFSTINNQQAPYREAGYSSLKSILGGLGLGPATGGVVENQFTHQFGPDDLKTHLAPNYEFVLDQGTRATMNALNRTGGVAGNTLQGINDYVQNYAGNEYQRAFQNYNANQTNIFNRLSNIAGLGQTANQTTANAGSTISGNAAQSEIASGQARAAGTIGVANALTGAGNNAMGWYALPQLLQAFSGSANA